MAEKEEKDTVDVAATYLTLVGVPLLLLILLILVALLFNTRGEILHAIKPSADPPVLTDS